MAITPFLKIDGIPGESVDARHKGEIALVSFSWGASRASAGAKVAVQDFHFAAITSVASPLLAQACATGKHLPTARLSVTKTGEGQAEYYVVTLTDVMVTSYMTGTTPLPTGGYGPLAGDGTVDQFTFSFASAEYLVYAVDPRGGRGNPIKVTISGK